MPIPKGVCGITKLAAEASCALMHRLHGLPCIALRTSRFFPEDDDLSERAAAHVDANLKLNELPSPRGHRGRRRGAPAGAGRGAPARL